MKVISQKIGLPFADFQWLDRYYLATKRAQKPQWSRQWHRYGLGVVILEGTQGAGNADPLGVQVETFYYHAYDMYNTLCEVRDSFQYKNLHRDYYSGDAI